LWETQLLPDCILPSFIYMCTRAREEQGEVSSDSKDLSCSLPRWQLAMNPGPGFGWSERASPGTLVTNSASRTPLLGSVGLDCWPSCSTPRGRCPGLSDFGLAEHVLWEPVWSSLQLPLCFTAFICFKGKNRCMELKRPK